MTNNAKQVNLKKRESNLKVILIGLLEKIFLFITI